MPDKSSPNPESADALSLVLDDFDYRVDCDDFLLYELGRLIEEDRASFQDEEFRRVIDEGIHEHVDRRLEIRAEMAMRLRRAYPRIDEAVRPIAARALQAIEDTDFFVRDVGLVARTYTTYLFRKLEECAGESFERKDEAWHWIQLWQRGEVLREEMTPQLKVLGRPAVAPLADFLFDSLDERSTVETLIDIIGSIQSSESARVLAHLISEPMLDEDLEMRTYALVKTMWPLPRHYIIYSLKPHTHEDIPFRWFQLLVEANEPDAIDRILEEVLSHGENPNFRADLLVLIELLSKSSDPGIEEKIMQVLNTPDVPRQAVEMLEQFLKSASRPEPNASADPWASLSRLQAANKAYLAAAKLFDSGRKADALRRINELLKENPRYPFAVMLKRLI